MVSIKFRQKIDLRYYKLVYRVGKKLNKKDKDITKRIIKRPLLSIASEEFADTFSQYVNNQKPLLLARLGGTEGNVAGEYCEKRLGLRKAYSNTVINWFYTTSGFFADDYANKEQAMDQYAELTLEGIKECDYLSAFFLQGFICHSFSSIIHKMLLQRIPIPDLASIKLQISIGSEN